MSISQSLNRRPHDAVMRRLRAGRAPARMLALCLAAALAPSLLACAADAQPPGGLPAAPAAPAVELPTATATAEGSLSPGSQVAPTETASPRPTSPPLPRVAPLEPPAYASRVVLPGLAIDLPVISGDLQPPPNYPLCDVAAYVTRFGQPYEPGVTYISAHAQRGMFLPLLEASQRSDGQELLGQRVEVYTNDGRLFGYQIERVVRHATDYAILSEISLDERHLILQTSEGPYGTFEKLQVVASFQEEQAVDLTAARPEASPRDCRPAEAPPSPSS